MTDPSFNEWPLTSLQELGRLTLEACLRVFRRVGETDCKGYLIEILLGVLWRHLLIFAKICTTFNVCANFSEISSADRPLNTCLNSR